MSLEDFIIVVYVWVDDQLKAWLGPQRLRQRGFAPPLSDTVKDALRGRRTRP